SQLSVVHGLSSVHVSGVPPTQCCPRHVSSPLHTLPSPQNAPSFSGVPGLHFWFWQVSCPLHGLPSSHVVPVGGGLPGEHTPPWQVSCPLHGSWSPHLLPSTFETWRQPASLLHESTVHSLWSSQSGFVPPRQMPARQVSAPLH